MIGTYPFGEEKLSRRAVHRTGTIDVLDLYVAKDQDGSWAFAIEGPVSADGYGHPTRKAALYASADAVQAQGWRTIKEKRL